MSFYKEVPGRKTTLESTLKFDTEPKAGSTNPVTSGGVAEAVGGASDALQEQIDDIAEKAGSGYTPKGPASVATLNGLTGQDNGWLYTMTDAGTLTDGSLAVVAGDTVAWDATNSVWYKAMDYAPRQYGTNEVHNLPTTITAFRTGDVIPVDGPDGTAKMSKDDLLRETAENAVNSGVAADSAKVGLYKYSDDLSAITEYNVIISGGGTWYYSHGKHRSLKLNKGWRYDVSCLATSESNGAIAILNSSFVEGNSQSGAVPFSTNYPARIVVNKGAEFSFVAQDGDAYLFVVSENSFGEDLLYSVEISGGSIKKAYDDISDYVGLFGSYDLSTTTEYNYIPGGQGTWYTPGKHKSLKIVNGATYKIVCKTTSESTGAIAILNSSFVEGNSQSGSVPFSTNYPARIVIEIGNYFEFTASEGDAYICFITENGVGQYLDYTADVRAGALERVYDEVEELADYVGVFERKDFSTITEYNVIISGSGTWYYSHGKHRSLKLNKGWRYDVSCLATSESNGAIAILNSSFVEGNSQSGAVPFSTNYPARIVVNKGAEFSFVAQDGDAYLFVVSENSFGEQLDYAVKIVSGLSKNILDDTDSGTAEVRLKILEYNVGGFDNGNGFVDPSVDVCKDLHHFICDNAPDIFVPCEVINSEANFWKTMRAIFSQVNTLPGGFGKYSAIANLNIGGVQYTKLYCYKDAETQSSARAQLMASFEIAGCKIAFVPWHGQTLNGTWAGLSWDTIKANLDNWFEQMGEESYDVVFLCGDTNVFWNTDSDIGLANNYNIVQYFIDKGYCYVNGGRGSTSQQVDLDFTNNFAEDTYINPAGHIPGTEGCVYNIDNLVMRNVSGKFNIAATFKVFSDAYMLANYPNLRGATYPDHIPVLFEVKISKV